MPAPKPRPSRANPAPPVKTEPCSPCKLPLYRNDSDDDMPRRFLYDDASEDDIRVELQAVTMPTAARSKRARHLASPSPSSRRPASPAHSLSPSMSSVLSISTATTGGSSASAVRRIPRNTVLQSAAATASSASTSGFGSPFTCLLYNSAKQTLYKDVEKVVREM
ncbi:hypothetical protein DFH09DRAFT_1343348 [Mycena vulgaris]|nr:hypothetical protein DFH09DRAFT_1343348 [Mycena vulgaris]